MILIDGKKTSADIKEDLAKKIDELKQQGKQIPGQVTIIVGKNPASKVYVNSKHKTCQKIGMKSHIEELPEDISESDLLTVIKKYNESEEFHGILIQLPLPKHIDEEKVIMAIDPVKDVDGFHPVNIGNLLIGRDTYIPCTPFGVVELIKRYEIETAGKHVVVVGRSNIVGKPVANLLVQKAEGANAIVTICHSAAKDLTRYTKDADILIAAVGIPNFIKADMVKEGVAVLDVGINSIDAPDSPKGYKIVGDVDFDSVSEKASHITPVPGGCGPMTIAMLLQNTYKAYLKLEKVN